MQQRNLGQLLSIAEPEHFSIEELRELSRRLRVQARGADDSGIGIQLAKAALALAQIAEALSRRTATGRDEHA